MLYFSGYKSSISVCLLKLHRKLVLKTLNPGLSSLNIASHMGSKITSALELAQEIVHAHPFYAGKPSLPLLFILDPS